MKNYQKPSIEYVEFVSEVITDVPGMSGGAGNPSQTGGVVG